MTTLQYVVLEGADPAAANAFHQQAFGLDPDQVRTRASTAPTSGFRGFLMSLVVAQPSTVESLLQTARSAGATTLKPAAKSPLGYGGTVHAPDGVIWTVASSAGRAPIMNTRKGS